MKKSKGKRRYSILSHELLQGKSTSKARSKPQLLKKKEEIEYDCFSGGPLLAILNAKLRQFWKITYYPAS
jgi:hypothetical protein